jgi:hypothetical protein
MTKQPSRTPGIVTDADIDGLCDIAKIPEAGRAAFAVEFRAAVEAATRRGANYKAPDPVPPMIAASNAISEAALELINAVERCDPETRALVQGMLFDGTINGCLEGVRDLWSASSSLAHSLRFANGRDRNAPGPPSKEILNPGISGGDIFTFDICATVYRHGGKLTLNESSNTLRPGGSLEPFFDYSRSLVPKGAGPTTAISRLKAIRNQVRLNLKRANNLTPNSAE